MYTVQRDAVSLNIQNDERIRVMNGSVWWTDQREEQRVERPEASLGKMGVNAR